MSSPRENTFMRGLGVVNWNVSKEKQFITREEKLKYEQEQQTKKKIHDKDESSKIAKP